MLTICYRFYFPIDKEVRLALFGVENQTSYDPDMMLRVFCYEGAGYRWQLTENKNIGRNEFRYPVVTFVLNFSTKEKWKKKHLLDRVKVPKSLLPFVNDYKVNVIDLAWLDEETTKLFHGEMRFLIEYLSAVRQNKKLKLSDEVITHYNELIELFSLLSGITNESLSAVFTEEEKQKEEIHVNDFMAKMFANARAEGEAKGRAEGEARGEARGQQKTAFNLRNMGMEEGFIAKAVGVTEAVIRKWFAEGQKVAML